MLQRLVEPVAPEYPESASGLEPASELKMSTRKGGLAYALPTLNDSGAVCIFHLPPDHAREPAGANAALEIDEVRPSVCIADGVVEIPKVEVGIMPAVHGDDPPLELIVQA